MPRLSSWQAALLVLGAACGRPAAPAAAAVDLRAVLGGGDQAGYARALQARELSFPRDHGPHPAFRTEWWYWTGNVATGSGRAFGFQLVFFRQALAAGVAARTGALAARDVVLAHAALTDVQGRRFLAAERLQRADGLRAAIAGNDAPLQLFCGEWSARAAPDGDGLLPLRLQARDGGFAFDLTVRAGKALVLQGEAGLSQKGSEPGNASIYYSMTRLSVAGTVAAGGQEQRVHGQAWFDREWSTSALSPGQVGWDWFSLQLDDQTELMWYRLRRDDGREDAHSQGLFVAADGTTRRLRAGDVGAVARGTFRADDGAADYPLPWHLSAPALGLELDVAPRVEAQELRLLVRYWEGAVEVTGVRAGRAVRGVGYLEMTGYARPPRAVQTP